jgi:hypothetical protein
VGSGGSGLLGTVTAFGSGDTHSVARLGDSSVWSWGSNAFAQLGYSTTAQCAGLPCHPTPQQLSSPVSMTNVAAGALHNEAVSVGASTTAVDGGTPLVGDPTLETKVDTSAAGTAKAFRYTATASGSANQMWVYLHNTNAATQVAIGLYADAAGAPGTLLAQGTITSPRNGLWNSASLPVTQITSGTTYWIALLAPATTGQLVFQDQTGGGTTSSSSSQTTLTSLPTTWSSGSSGNGTPHRSTWPSRARRRSWASIRSARTRTRTTPTA